MSVRKECAMGLEELNKNLRKDIEKAVEIIRTTEERMVKTMSSLIVKVDELDRAPTHEAGTSGNAEATDSTESLDQLHKKTRS